jgi:aerobic C4-dicarboxylate transport protein
MRSPIAQTTPWYSKPHVQVLIGLALGVLVGQIWPEVGTSLKPLGDAFIRVVKMVISPIIFLTVVHGIAGRHDMRQAGRISLKAIVWFEACTSLALVIGLIAVNSLKPGAGMNVSLDSLDPQLIESYTTHARKESVVEFLMNIIPDSAVGAFVEGRTLQVLFFAVLFGIALQRFGERGKPLVRVIGDASRIFFLLIGMIMRAAPIGAFGAMAFTVGKYGFGAILALGNFVFEFYATCLFFVLVVLGIVAKVFGFSIFKLIRYLAEELLLIFGLSGSEPVLPRLMTKMEAAGCSESVVALVVPTGYTFNLDGTCIYLTMATLFLAQATNTPLPLAQQLTLLAVCLLTSKGSAAIPGSGFIVLAATLGSIGHIPVASIALILGIDRFMSQARALTNFIGTAVATIVISRWEGELDQDCLRATLDAPPQPP